MAADPENTAGTKEHVARAEPPLMSPFSTEDDEEDDNVRVWTFCPLPNRDGSTRLQHFLPYSPYEVKR